MTALLKTTAIAGFMIAAAAGSATAASSADMNPAATTCGDFVAMDQDGQMDAMRAMRIELSQENQSDSNPKADPLTAEKPATGAAPDSHARTGDMETGDDVEVAKEDVTALQLACMGESDKMAIDVLSDM